MRRASAKSPARAGRGEVVHRARDLVGDHRDDAFAAERHEGERDGVVAGEHLEALRAGRAGCSITWARLPEASFTAAMFGCSARRSMRLGVDVAARAAGDVVDDDRHRAGVGHGGEVAEEAFGRRLVVVRARRRGCPARPGRPSPSTSRPRPGCRCCPRPASTGTLPFASSTRDRDHALLLGGGHASPLSPVVPQGTSTSIFASTWRRDERGAARPRRASPVGRERRDQRDPGARERSCWPCSPLRLRTHHAVASDVVQRVQLLARLGGHRRLAGLALQQRAACAPTPGPRAPGTAPARGGPRAVAPGRARDDVARLARVALAVVERQPGRAVLAGRRPPA